MSLTRLKDYLRNKLQSKLGEDSIFSPRVSSPVSEKEEMLRGMARPRTQKSYTSVRQSLVRRCHSTIASKYFEVGNLLDAALFTLPRKEMEQMTSALQEQLDDVEVALFNQITGRFDQVLSVLRTVQSLDCLVHENRAHIALIRNQFLTNAKAVQTQIRKVNRLITIKNNLNQALQLNAQILLYKQLSQNCNYTQINRVKENTLVYNKLLCMRDFTKSIDIYETNLKKGFTDTINDVIVGTRIQMQMILYSPNFWSKLSNRSDLLDESKVENCDTTVILDDEEDQYEKVGNIFNSSKQNQIVSHLIKGWEEGQYTVGTLKAAIDKLLKQISQKFMQDCRVFCHKSTRKEIENPNLENLLQQMSILFCNKIFKYCFYVHKPIILRIFSIVRKCINSLLQIVNNNNKSQETEANNITIECSQAQFSILQKQKLTILTDGLLSVALFTFKNAYTRCLQLFEQKVLYQSMDISDLRNLLGILQSQSYFIKTELQPLMQFSTTSFLKPKIVSCIERFDFEMLSDKLYAKLSEFLHKSQKYTIEIQLKESMQNQEWTATDIPTFYYDSLHFLLTGQNLRRREKTQLLLNADTSVLISRLSAETSYFETISLNEFRIVRNEIIIEHKTYKVTPTVLLLIELVEDLLYIKQCYPKIETTVVKLLKCLIEWYNEQSYQMIVMAGAVGLGRLKTKNITAKHLALCSLCLSFLKCLLVSIQVKFAVDLPPRLVETLTSHQDAIYTKLNQILLTKINQSLGDVGVDTTPSKGTETIVSSTKILHDILKQFYQVDVLAKIFTKNCFDIYLNKLNALPIKNNRNAEALKDQIEFYFQQLHFLSAFVQDFIAIKFNAQEIVRNAFQKL